MGFMGLELNGEIRNDNIDLEIVNKVAEILGTNKIFRWRVWNKQKAALINPQRVIDTQPAKESEARSCK